jgi:hypothetical protein
MAGRRLPGAAAGAPRALLAAALVGIVAGPLAFAASADAQTFTVTNLSDSGAVGDGSLRGEVKAANESLGADDVIFAPGLSGTITFAQAGIVITDPIDIEGPGSGVVTIHETVPRRIFKVEPIGYEPATIAGLHLDGGTAPPGGEEGGMGGDIYSAEASLTLSDDLITGGTASALGGGVSDRDGPLVLRNSTVSGNQAGMIAGVDAGGPGWAWAIQNSTIAGNTATGYAGGFSGEADQLGTIENSTISGNRAGAAAGALLESFPGGHIVVRNSTVAGNVAATEAGGLEVSIETNATATIEGSTIAGNRVESGDGGGIEVFGAPQLTIGDSIVAGNSATGSGPDIDSHQGAVSTAFSLLGGISSGGFGEAVPGSDLLGVDPQLGPLADNGGPTETMALPPTSPAVNKGGGELTTDQRGDPRPVVYPGVASSTAPGANGDDIGAYELAAPPVPPALPIQAATNPAPPPAAKKKKRLRQPRVTVSCPRRAKPTGCHFALQAFSARPGVDGSKGHRARAAKPVAESLVTVANLRPGKSAMPTLTPKPRFAAKLDAAKSLLVREAVTIGGRRSVSYRRLKVVG